MIDLDDLDKKIDQALTDELGNENEPETYAIPEDDFFADYVSENVSEFDEPPAETSPASGNVFDEPEPDSEQLKTIAKANRKMADLIVSTGSGLLSYIFAVQVAKDYGAKEQLALSKDEQKEISAALAETFPKTKYKGLSANQNLTMVLAMVLYTKYDTAVRIRKNNEQKQEAK